VETFVGKKFGKLEVLRELPAVRDNGGNLRRWMEVKCDCGKVVEKKLKYLKNGDTTSCGKCVYEVVDKSTKGLPIVALDPLDDELEMIGGKYQAWLVLSAGFRRGTARMMKVRCVCGTEQYVCKSVLISGQNKSCGCESRERISEAIRTHGMAGSKPYRIWANMRSRCNNPNSTFFLNYGGRGINHQDSWEDFEAFWADMGSSYVEGLELDRIDVDGGYCVENCRWADDSTQAYNQRQHKNNTSGKTGVVLNKRTGHWVSKINVENERIYLGTFVKLEDAIKAREEAEIKYYGELKGH
jgi:hypothetical protein